MNNILQFRIYENLIRICINNSTYNLYELYNVIIANMYELYNTLVANLYINDGST